MAWRIGLIIGALLSAAPAAAKDPPLALVERVESAPAARLEPFDYVYPGDEVDLRPSGALRLAYFKACFVEDFQGGTVRITKDGARSRGGRSTRAARPCETAALSVAGGREAGVAVKRISPFEGASWRELAVRTARPTFTWPRAAGGDAKVEVFLLEAAPKQLVWSGAAADHALAYPDAAPALAVGLPYEVVVSPRSGAPLSTVFSVDPGLEASEGLLATVVPLGF